MVTFQQDNNLKHKAKYTLELLTKMTLNSLVKVLTEKKSIARLENGRLPMINNQLDRT
jgi:hypothetical protein